MACSIDMGIKQGKTAWARSKDMQHTHALMEMQHGHAVQICSTDMYGHAALTSSTDKQHGKAARTYSMGGSINK